MLPGRVVKACESPAKRAVGKITILPAGVAESSSRCAWNESLFAGHGGAHAAKTE